MRQQFFAAAIRLRRQSREHVLEVAIEIVVVATQSVSLPTQISRASRCLR